jgi:hypothetical protein
MYDDYVVLGNDPVNRRRGAVEVTVERLDRLAQTVASLGTGRVLHEVLRDVLEGGAIA